MHEDEERYYRNFCNYYELPPDDTDTDRLWAEHHCEPQFERGTRPTRSGSVVIEEVCLCGRLLSQKVDSVL